MARQQFSSGLTTVLTMAGAAIGLGNIWRFPYMMGSYGGSAFFLVYLLFVLLLAIPAMSGEWALGRRARGGTISAFVLGFGAGPGRWVGYLLITGMIFATSYYLVVIGNVAYTTWFSIVSGFSTETNPQFLQGLDDRPLQYSSSLLVLTAILWVAYKGLNNGIERVSKLFVPFFFGVILYLIAVTFRLEGAVAKMAVFLQPDFSRLTLQSIFAALGQAAFSVGLGGTIMVIYGSYLRPDTSLLRGACVTAFADTGAALLAALFIFPTILVFGIAPQAGPTLLFETLPHLFSLMEGGRWVGSFFLIALLMVAFLSGLAALEVIIGSISDDFEFNRLNRRRCILIFGSLEGLIMLVPAFVPDAIATMDLIFGSGMLALGSALTLIALTWGLSRVIVLEELGAGWLTPWLYRWLRWVVPFVVLGIIGTTLVSET